MLKRHGPLAGIGATQAAMINHLRRKGAASRAEIADFCGVTAAAVSMMTRDLIQRGVIVEGARRHGGRGAPHIDLLLQGNVGYALGVHANHYSLTLTLLDFSGKRIGEHHLDGPFEAFCDVEESLSGVKSSFLRSCDVAEDLLLGAGMAMPTRFRQGAASLDLADEVISWAGPDLASSLREILHCPVIIENDANAAAVGELALGNAAGHDNFAYLYLSEGIGSGIVIGGELYRGNLGNAGDVGVLRPRGQSRPSFDDLAAWCTAAVGSIPKGRSSEQWSIYLEEHSNVLDAWLERAGPETAQLIFLIASVLAPSAIFLGGTLPRLVRERLAQWLNFDKNRPLEGVRVVQPSILIPEVEATDTAAFGAAAMILHTLPSSS